MRKTELPSEPRSTNFEQEKNIKQENEYKEELDYDYHDKGRD